MSKKTTVQMPVSKNRPHEFVMNIGIAVPDGTDRDGVSLLKASLIATAEECATTFDDGKVDEHASVFHLRTPVDRKRDDADASYALHAMLSAQIVIRHNNDITPPNIPEAVDEEDIDETKKD